MASFVNVKYSTQHLGVARVESAIDAVKHLRQDFSALPGFATPLLGVTAPAFRALTFVGGSSRQLLAGLIRRVDGWSRGFSKARLDWAMAGKTSL